MSSRVSFKNTFAPDCDDPELTVGDIVAALRFGFLNYKNLPKEVQDAVDEELARLGTKQYSVSLPHLKEGELASLRDLCHSLLSHDIQPSDLPADIRKVVDDDKRMRIRMSLQEWWDKYHAAEYEEERKERIVHDE